jgi:hypothetical protein
MTVATFASVPSARVGLGRQQLILILLVVYIIGAHLRLSIYANGSILVPMYLMLLPSVALSLWFAPEVLRRIGGGLALMLAFLVLQPLVGGGGGGYESSIKSVIQLVASMGGALAMILALGLVDPGRLRWVLLVLWGAMIVLALIESLGLKPVFDQIRDWLYAGSGRFVYLAEDRDLQIYGRVRTTVFASEPSFLADTLSALVVMILLLGAQRAASFVLFGAMIAVSFLVAPSFKTAFYVAAVVVWYLWPRDMRSLSRLALILAAGVAGAQIGMAVIGDVAGTHLSSGSFFGRIGSAHLVAMQALGQFPLYGFGIGKNDAVQDIIVQIWNESGAFTLFPWYGGLSATDLMSNGFWWMWIYLGLFGGVTFLWLGARLLAGVGVAMPLRSLTCASIVWYAGSAFVDPQSWYMLVVFSTGALVPRDTGPVG